MQKMKIVIVDNDEDEQFFIKKGFLATGLFDLIGIFANGNDFLNDVKQLGDIPDAILSDLNMPGKTGLEILEDLKRDPALSHIPVILSSNATTPELNEQCIRSGAFALKGKPDDFLNYEKFATDLYHELKASR